MQNKYISKVLFSQQEIEQKCKELANWINVKYKKTKDLVIVGLLKGSLPFIAQLIKNINILHSLDFMIVSSYNGKEKRTSNVKIVLDLKKDIQDKDVLIVEDIVDSGITLKKIVSNLKQRKPKSINTLVLLDKKEARVNDFEPDKYGFVCENEFLIGFGLDYNEKFRNYPFIGVFNKKYLNKV